MPSPQRVTRLPTGHEARSPELLCVSQLTSLFTRLCGHSRDSTIGTSGLTPCQFVTILDDINMHDIAYVAMVKGEFVHDFIHEASENAHLKAKLLRPVHLAGNSSRRRLHAGFHV